MLTRIPFATVIMVALSCGHLVAEPPKPAGPEGSEKISLPGLEVSLGMSVDEVSHQLQNQKFRHVPEKRWQKNGHSLSSPEVIVSAVVPLRELNEQLVEARFIFEKHTLVSVSLAIIHVQNAIKPLIDSLQLVPIPKQPGNYLGLKGAIIMRDDFGDAEKTSWVIRRAE